MGSLINPRLISDTNGSSATGASIFAKKTAFGIEKPASSRTKLRAPIINSTHAYSFVTQPPSGSCAILLTGELRMGRAHLYAASCAKHERHHGDFWKDGYIDDPALPKAKHCYRVEARTDRGVWLQLHRKAWPNLCPRIIGVLDAV